VKKEKILEALKKTTEALVKLQLRCDEHDQQLPAPIQEAVEEASVALELATEVLVKA